MPFCEVVNGTLVNFTSKFNHLAKSLLVFVEFGDMPFSFDQSLILRSEPLNTPGSVSCLPSAELVSSANLIVGLGGQ